MIAMLRAPQPLLLSLLVSAWSSVYSCATRQLQSRFGHSRVSPNHIHQAFCSLIRCPFLRSVLFFLNAGAPHHHHHHHTHMRTRISFLSTPHAHTTQSGSMTVYHSTTAPAAPSALPYSLPAFLGLLCNWTDGLGIRKESQIVVGVVFASRAGPFRFIERHIQVSLVSFSLLNNQGQDQDQGQRTLLCQCLSRCLSTTRHYLLTCMACLIHIHGGVSSLNVSSYPGVSTACSCLCCSRPPHSMTWLLIILPFCSSCHCHLPMSTRAFAFSRPFSVSPPVLPFCITPAFPSLSSLVLGSECCHPRHRLL